VFVRARNSNWPRIAQARLYILLRASSGCSRFSLSSLRCARSRKLRHDFGDGFLNCVCVCSLTANGCLGEAAENELLRLSVYEVNYQRTLGVNITPTRSIRRYQDSALRSSLAARGNGTNRLGSLEGTAGAPTWTGEPREWCSPEHRPRKVLQETQTLPHRAQSGAPMDRLVR
jgi:hypothetical protein